jgi:hypothetical protein
MVDLKVVLTVALLAASLASMKAVQMVAWMVQKTVVHLAS